MKNSIKSFSKARSRSSLKNKHILSKANEIFFVTEDNFQDFKFLNEDPFKLNLEIGFGDGKYLTEHALNNPKQSFIGIEVFESGLANPDSNTSMPINDCFGLFKACSVKYFPSPKPISKFNLKGSSFKNLKS